MVHRIGASALGLAFLVALPVCDGDAATPIPPVPEPVVRDAPKEAKPSLATPDSRSFLIDVDGPTRELAASGQWEKLGAKLKGVEGKNAAFLRAWSLIESGEAKEAVELLDAARTSDAPGPYREYVAGELLWADGKTDAALKALASVPDSSVVASRAVVRHAAILAEADREGEALEVLRRMAKQEGASAAALRALYNASGDADEKKEVGLRLWTSHPMAAESEGVGVSTSDASNEQKALRAERLMAAGQYDAAGSLLAPLVSKATSGSEHDCRIRYVAGRSHYKRNRLTEAITAFGDVVNQCKGTDGNYGPRSGYLLGTATFRRGLLSKSATTYRALVDNYPENSMADDALTRGGISLQRAGKDAEAIKWWNEALEKYPAGDTVPEATWRLAFTEYREGNTSKAMEIAAKLGNLPLDGDAEHVAAGRYWEARWRLYGDVKNPTKLTATEEEKEAALADLAKLCKSLPHSYYAVLAFSRLKELDPERADSVQRSKDHVVGDVDAVAWQVRPEVFGDSVVQTGVSLARVGLIGEAKKHWTHLDDLPPEEKAWLTQLRIEAGDWLYAHDNMRHYLKSHALTTLGPNEPAIVRLSYPDRYWAEVQESVEDDYLMEPRLFHGLVREESNFNRRIVSFAGARGLSQLMPATARQTAGWLGMKITMDDLETPTTNLKIGARYLHQMHKQLSRSPYLSLAAYNGGAGNVNKWIGEVGNLPTDEYVELIPFRETRGYVKRVTGTWQTLRWHFDLDQPGFPDLSAFNHAAKPKDG